MVLTIIYLIFVFLILASVIYNMLFKSENVYEIIIGAVAAIVFLLRLFLIK